MMLITVQVQPKPGGIGATQIDLEATASNGADIIHSTRVVVRVAGPPVLLPNAQRQRGTQLRQFVGTAGWLGQTGAISPPSSAGVHIHLRLDIGTQTDMCRWPLQAAGVEDDLPPGVSCITTWADPLQYLPQANPDTLVLVNGTAEPVVSGAGRSNAE